MANLKQSWESIKDRVFDASGILEPEKWVWENKGGIFYPAELAEVKTAERTEFEQLFESHDPDATDEELESMGFVIKSKMTYGHDAVVDYREGCGHLVTE